MEPLTRIALARLLNVSPGTVTCILAKHGWAPQKRRAKNETLTESQVLCVIRNFYFVECDEPQQQHQEKESVVQEGELVV
jgi:hypothetical protein